MTLKQELFALQYVKAAGDIEASATAMKMKVASCKRYLRNDDVQNYISELNADIEKVCKINKASIVQKHLEIHDSAMKGDKRYNKDGIKLDRKPDRAAANKALENVSTLMGYNAPQKVDVSLDLSVWLTQQTTEVIDVETT